MMTTVNRGIATAITDSRRLDSDRSEVQLQIAILLKYAIEKASPRL